MKKIIASILLLLFSTSVLAEISPNTVRLASKGKRNRYSFDAIIRGGDPLAQPISLRNIRWAKNAGFERIVIDLEGESSGWEQKVPPYFQAGISGGKKEIEVGIRGIQQRLITNKQIQNIFVKSRLIASAILLPDLEGDLASFQLKLKNLAEVETFYLVNPPRIILDVRIKK